MSCVILDLRRLTEMDSTGTNVLLDLQENLNRRKIDLLLAAGPHSAATQRLAELGRCHHSRRDPFPDVDRAIERAEDDLLRAREPASAGEIALSEAAVFAGFEPRQLSAVTALMMRQTYTEGSVVFREGDPGDEVMIVTQGTASAYLQLQNGANIRLARLCRVPYSEKWRSSIAARAPPPSSPTAISSVTP